ncbi:MAG: hypothetical protein ACRCZZ_10450 [Phocaeicola sp.]
MCKSIKSWLLVLSGILVFSSCSKGNVVEEATDVTIIVVSGVGGSISEEGEKVVAPGTELSSNIVTVNRGYEFLGWYDGDLQITETSSEADAYLSAYNRQLNIKAFSDKSYIAKFGEIDCDIPEAEKGQCAPRICVIGTESNAKLMLTGKIENCGVFFQFGSVIAWDYSSGVAASNVLFNPSDTVVSGWNSKHTVGDSFPDNNVKNLKEGKGDPCRLIGLSQGYIKDELNSNRAPDNGKWRLPTEDGNKEVVANCSDWTCIGDIYGIYFGPGASLGGTDGEFLPGLGFRQNTNGSLVVPKIHGQYWSSTKFKYTPFQGIALKLNSIEIKADYPYFQAGGLSVRCVPQ